MGLSPEHARSSVRFSLGRWTSSRDIEYVAETVPPIVERIRRTRGWKPENARSAA